MISLTKLSEPRWLIDNAAAETANFVAAPANHKPSPWRNKEVVAILKLESSRKCMYCEAIIDDSGYSAVEHIRPKKHFPERVLVWTNLGLACDRCNTNKGDYWADSEDLRLLNPFEDSVADHLEFQGPVTMAKLDSSRGQNTVRKLKLTTRQDLLLSRMARIQALSELLRIWLNESRPEHKKLFAEDVASAIAGDQEHSAVLRAYAATQGFPVD